MSRRSRTCAGVAPRSFWLSDFNRRAGRAVRGECGEHLLSKADRCLVGVDLVRDPVDAAGEQFLRALAVEPVLTVHLLLMGAMDSLVNESHPLPDRAADLVVRLLDTDPSPSRGRSCHVRFN